MERHRRDEASRAAAEFAKPLVDDDRYLDALARGENPSHGRDQLAALLLELRDEVEAPQPSAPVVCSGSDNRGHNNVVDLAAARERRSRPLLHGIIGAAAATTVLAGSAALLDASAFWGRVDGSPEDPTVVQLAGTLDRLGSSTEKGDMDATRELLRRAQELVSDIEKSKGSDSWVPGPKPSVTETSTTTVTVPAPPPGLPEPEPVAVRETTTVQAPLVTQTVTVTIPAPTTEKKEPALKETPKTPEPTVVESTSARPKAKEGEATAPPNPASKS